MTEDQTNYPPCELALSPRQWIVAAATAAVVLIGVPLAVSRSDTAPLPTHYRIPYDRSDDYWQFRQCARKIAGGGELIFLGDSVVWGHFATADQTLPARLAAMSGQPCFNLGVDGTHPAALAGLIEHYGGPIRGRDVVLHLNLLWMSSPRLDLKEEADFPLNHPRLMPQFWPPAPCYRPSTEQRLTYAVGVRCPLFDWASHLQFACFEGQSVANWTLTHPYEDPVATRAKQPGQSRFGDFSPAPPGTDCRPWQAKGMKPYSPPWVDLDKSIQWSFFRNAVAQLRGRDNRVFVIVGPFNEHMLTDVGRDGYCRLVSQAKAWLRAEGVPCVVPAALASDEYADASHPLAQGYERLAREVFESEAFGQFAGEARKDSAR